VRKANFFQHGVDFLVFGLAVGRVMGKEVMHISGHTLLLSYMLATSRSKIVLIASILVLAQTLVLKYYVWGDFVTSNVGLVVGCALALIVRWVSQRSETSGS
jgi:Zn-dependent protease with chaperone function